MFIRAKSAFDNLNQMKLRIKGNSIRLRLLRSEVDEFREQESLSEEINFGTTSLRYSLRMSADAESIHATLSNNEIEVSIPQTDARDWTVNDEVGFEAEQPLGNGEVLTIIIEKDFVCVDRPDDPDRQDAYPNPKVTC